MVLSFTLPTRCSATGRLGSDDTMLEALEAVLEADVASIWVFSCFDD